MNHTLCLQPSDPKNCRIGFIADQATKDAVFDPDKLKLVFNKTSMQKNPKYIVYSFEGKCICLFCSEDVHFSQLFKFFRIYAI